MEIVKAQQSSRQEQAIGAGREQRIRELDGWRAISVLLVLCNHLFSFQRTSHLTTTGLPGHLLRSAGPLGVHIFFVISGFVITRLLIAEETRYGSVSLGAFYVRRAFRILPPFYLYLVVLACLLPLGLVGESWKSLLARAAFLGDFEIPRSWGDGWFTGHTWSLAVEEQFYLVFPTLWILIPKPWRAGAFLATFLACLAWSLALIWNPTGHLLLPEARMGFACIGGGVLLAVFEHRARLLLDRIPAIWVALPALLLLLHPAYFNTPVFFLLDGVVAPLAIPIILAFTLHRGGSVRRLLLCWPLQKVGRMSYGVYLWQQLFTASLDHYHGWARLIPGLLPTLALIVPASYSWLEKPAMRMGHRLSAELRSSQTGRPAGSLDGGASPMDQPGQT